VILNEEAGGYEQPLRERLEGLIQAHSTYTGKDQPGGIFLRSVDQIPEEDLTLLMAAASVVLVAARGTLLQACLWRFPSCRNHSQETRSPGAFSFAALHGAALLQQPGRFYPGWA